MDDPTRIEEHLAHLTRSVDELSDVVSSQARQIARLEARVALLMEREAAREADPVTAPRADRRPPHW